MHTEKTPLFNESAWTHQTSLFLAMLEEKVKLSDSFDEIMNSATVICDTFLVALEQANHCFRLSEKLYEMLQNKVQVVRYEPSLN